MKRSIVLLCVIAQLLMTACDEGTEPVGQTDAQSRTDALVVDSQLPLDAQPGDAQPGDAQPSDAQPGDAQPGDAQPADAQSADAQSADAQPADAQPADASAIEGDAQAADASAIEGDAAPDSGACEAVCPLDAMRCDGPLERQRCVSAGPCSRWEPLAPCAALEACLDGACSARPAPELLINEVLYDGLGADRPTAFVELWGAPGTALDGLRLVGVNGNGGAEYSEIPLVGAIGDSGYFVVAHPDAEPALAERADLLDASADFQNGPDSIQLRWGDTVVDAVGYGRFADAVFAGEGTPAPDGDAGQSLSRDAVHTDTDDNRIDFALSEPSPGRPGASGPSPQDAGVPVDAGLIEDAAVPLDAELIDDAAVPLDAELIDDAAPQDAAPPLDADPFDERAFLVVHAPAGATVPDHVPDNLGDTTYGGGFGLAYDNDRYFVFETIGDRATEQIAAVPLGRSVRLSPGTYAVVLNDTFELVELDWNDRVELQAGRLEVVTPQTGTFTVRPGERFDNFARPQPLRGCGQFGNQRRSLTLFGGCDGALNGGVFDLSTGLNVLAATYRVAVDARFHSPNETFVSVEPGATSTHVPADTRATIRVDPPAAADLPDAAPSRPGYGPRNVPMRFSNDRFYVLRYLNIVDGFEGMGSSLFDRPLQVPAGRYYIVVNDTYVIREIAVGEALVVPTARVEIGGAGSFDLRPTDDRVRFNFVANPGTCPRDGLARNLFASCALPSSGMIGRGTGINVMPGDYELSVYDPQDALLSTRPLRAE